VKQAVTAGATAAGQIDRKKPWAIVARAPAGGTGIEAACNVTDR
jgi:hypothetical protein